MNLHARKSLRIKFIGAVLDVLILAVKRPFYRKPMSIRFMLSMATTTMERRMKLNANWNKFKFSS